MRTRSNWIRPGVCGVAMLQPAESGTRHGVYVTDDQGRVYAFLQKPSISELQAAGGLLPGDQVALDIGLLRFSPEAAVRLTQLRGDRREPAASINLYEHVPMALTGQWKPGPADSPALHALADALKDLPFWCSTVAGEFTHIGTTTLFRELMTEETEFSRLYAVQQRLGATRQPGLRSAGVVIDSVLAGGGDLGPATVVIDCNLTYPARAASGSVLHGLDGIPGPLEVPENTVIHQVPVVTPDGKRGTVIRVYGVEDDPKASVAAWTGYLVRPSDDRGIAQPRHGSRPRLARTTRRRMDACGMRNCSRSPRWRTPGRAPAGCCAFPATTPSSGGTKQSACRSLRARSGPMERPSKPGARGA